jgi:L-alanine-DL-glutamate epimerase-like enolase superfamily enzyme
MWTLTIEELAWPLKEPFVIARDRQTQVRSVLVTITDAHGARGRGEASGVRYHGETPATMTAAIEAVRPAIEAGVSREALLTLMPAGGARCAVDAALWDLEAKASGTPAWRAAGLATFAPVTTVYTIGIRDLDGYERAAAEHAGYAWLKVKVAGDDPLAAIDAVRRGAPHARLLIDANMAWDAERLKAFAPALAERGVALLEQPIAAGAEATLDGYRCPVPIVGDESVQDERDLDRVAGRFDVVNIKLDKTGGLTAALALADAVEARGMGLMVGCMVGSSLAMAPATILAQRCAHVDLDGPLLQASDWPDGLRFDAGVITPPESAFWG